MKVYYNQNKISSGFKKFFPNIFSLSKPLLNNFVSIIIGMISAESVVSSDIARKQKDSAFPINLDSFEHKFRRFFASFSPLAYSFYSALISSIISKFCSKHPDSKIHISIDHMFCKHKFTILLFSLRIGKQGTPIWFRCFKGTNDPNAFSSSLIIEGISFCHNLFNQKNYHIIFLADQWFPNVSILSFIHSIGCFYCFRCKSSFTFFHRNSHGNFIRWL